METREILEEIFKEYSEENRKILIKGTMKEILNREEEQKFKKLIAENLAVEGEKLKQSGEETPIEGYISFLSLAKNESWEKSPLEKSLEILQQRNLKKCYILATPETLEEAKKVQNKLRGNQRRDMRYDIEVIEVETEDYDRIYLKLEKIISYSGISHDNFIIDNTLGFKMIMGVFYKFSVEQGIRLISWQSRQYSDNGRLCRVPAMDKLNFLEFPQMKNFKLINNVNRLIENFRFEEAMNLCEAINNSDKKILLKKLSKIFTMETMLRIGSFGDELDETHSKIDIKGGKLEKLELELNDLFKRILAIEEQNEKLYNIFHSCLAHNFFRGYFNNNANYKGRFEEIIGQEFYENLDELELNISEDWSRNFEGILEDNILENEIDDALEYLEEFKELQEKLKIALPKQIELDETTLNIRKLGLKIELKKSVVGKNTNNQILIRKLLSNPNYHLELDEVEEQFEGKIDSKQYFDLKKIIKKFNEAIVEGLKTNNLDIKEDFISLPPEELKFFSGIKISEFYLV